MKAPVYTAPIFIYIILSTFAWCAGYIYACVGLLPAPKGYPEAILALSNDIH